MFAHVQNECNSSYRSLQPNLSGNGSPPACGGIKGGRKSPFTSCFALSFNMSQSVNPENPDSDNNRDNTDEHPSMINQNDSRMLVNSTNTPFTFPRSTQPTCRQMSTRPSKEQRSSGLGQRAPELFPILLPLYQTSNFGYNNPHGTKTRNRFHRIQKRKNLPKPPHFHRSLESSSHS